MKKGKRIVALALAVVMALGSVCYKPPKAEAVVVETAVVLAAAYTYLAATGFSFAGDGTAYGAMADVLESEMQKHMNEYSETVEVPNLVDTIANGVSLLGDGLVEFSAGAANILAQFETWFVEKFGLIGDDGTPVADSVSVYESNSFIEALEDSGIVLATGFPGGWTSSWSPNGTMISLDDVYQLPNGNEIRCILNPSGSVQMKFYSSAGELIADVYGGVSQSQFGGFWFGVVDNELSVIFKSGSQYCDGSCVQRFELYSGFVLENYNLSIHLDAYYEAAPTVDEQYSMVVNTGLTYADEQSFIDAVLGSAVVGALAPSYTIEAEAAGDIVTPGEDTDTQTGILSWVKKIWQSVAELPATIAQAVADVFVPSAEYMETVPVTIADTFDDRTGFLTYPASLVYDFGDMLHEGQQDFVLRWPTVREPYSKAEIMLAGQFNVSAFVRDNDSVATIYEIYQWVVKAYLTFLFLGLCKRKYNSVLGDRLGG